MPWQINMQDISWLVNNVAPKKTTMRQDEKNLICKGLLRMDR
jgi:hypothetical protein